MGKRPVGKRILVFEIVDQRAFAVWLEHFLDKLHVQRMFLIDVLLGLVLKNKVEGDLIGLVDHITVAAGHPATVIMLHAGAGPEVFFSASKQGLGGAGLVRFRPENNYVGEHGQDDMGGQTAGQSF